jgi:hypothetical protein
VSPTAASAALAVEGQGCTLRFGIARMKWRGFRRRSPGLKNHRGAACFMQGAPQMGYSPKVG